MPPRPKINVLARKQNRKEKKKLLKQKGRKPIPSSQRSISKHDVSSFEDEHDESVKKRKKVEVSSIPEEDPEDAEIKRLEKLLGISKDRKKKFTVLSKEYEEEGFGDDFVDFLDELDDISARAKGLPSKREASDEEESEERSAESDMESLESDTIHYSDEEEDMENIDELDGSEEEVEELEDESEKENSLEDEIDTSSNTITYRPVAGQDIYGRSKTTEDRKAVGAYVPPAARLRQTGNSTDEVAIKRSINGLMNRLSDATKDSICKSLKDVFSTHSKNLCTSAFCDSLYASCVHTSQLMTTFIPLHAAVVAALHAMIGFDVSCVIVENLIVKFFDMMSDIERSSEKQMNKEPLNILLLVLYLYDFRVLDSQLILEIVWRIINSKKGSPLSPYHVELMVVVVEHAGYVLRGDCPLELKQLIAHIIEMQKKAEIDVRTSVMLEMLADLKNNKSKRNVSSNADMIHSLRKWIGAFKHIDTSKAATPCIKVPLQDLLDGEQRGRWWRAGAFWEGRTASMTVSAPVVPKNANSEEDAMLQKIAKKLKMNTEIRKNIFMVVMSSRDVHDVFERLARLELKGKQDREILRVLTECCGAEKAYNPFYEEVAIALCTAGRQNKTTLQYCYWDLFKAITDESGSVSDRKVVNLARMMVGLVCGFHLSLSVLKPIELSTAPPALLLFLATFFIALFSNKKISEEEFASVLDRVSTTSDCVHIRELLLVFLKHHFKSLPSGLSPEDAALVKKRRAKTIKTMDAMSVLDVAKGMSAADDNE